MRRALILGLWLAAASAPAQDGVFGNALHLIRPCRILDTRITVQGVTMANRFVTAAGFTGVGALHDGELRRYFVMCGATCYDDLSRRPVGFHATAILVTVTAVGATGPGHMTLYDSTLDDPWSANYRGAPFVSTINFQAGAAVATTTVVELGQDQGYSVGDAFLPDLAIRATVSGGGTVHLVLDIVGVYFASTMPVQP